MSDDAYTITMSKEALLTVTGAILTSIRDDRRDLGAFALMSTWCHFVENEMTLKAEALAALNAATPEVARGALDNAVIATVLRELQAMRDLVAGGNIRMPVSPSESFARLGSLDAALYAVAGLE